VCHGYVVGGMAANGCHGCVVGVVTVLCLSWLRSGVALLRMGVTVP
jgi:hypothetical protein